MGLISIVSSRTYRSYNKNFYKKNITSKKMLFRMSRALRMGGNAGEKTAWWIGTRQAANSESREKMMYPLYGGCAIWFFCAAFQIKTGKGYWDKNIAATTKSFEQ